MSRTAFDLHSALTSWSLSPFSLAVLAALVAVGYWYLRADWKLAARGRKWSGKRTIAFFAGLLSIDAALQSPVNTFTANYFQAHVVQHLLLMVIGPPLLAMGAPMTLALQTSNRRTKTFILGILKNRSFKLITHPIPVWFLYYFTMYAFFLTSAVGAAMEHMWAMDIVNVAFFLAATLFWWPIVGLDPIPHWRMSYGARMVNLMIGVPIESFLGLTLTSNAQPVAPMYTLDSTHSGGAILWIGAEIFTVLAMIPVVIQWMRAEERKAARYDLQVMEQEDEARLQAT